MTMATNKILDLDADASLAEAVFVALGAASVCWETPEGAGVFDSSRAKAIGDELVAWIDAREPLLGYATTRQLLNEISTRIEVHSDGGLDYRTVDSG